MDDPEFTSRTSPRVYANTFGDLAMNVMGLALITPKTVPDVFTILTAAERHVMDYWAATRHAQDPLLFLNFEYVTALTGDPVLMFCESGLQQTTQRLHSA